MKHLVTAAALTVLAPATTWAMECADGLRSFEHRSGTACVPDDPQRIATLHDQNALLLPLMEMGVEPVAALEPNLIVASPWIEGAYEAHSNIAPTVLMAPSEVPFREALFDFAALVGRTDSEMSSPPNKRSLGLAVPGLRMIPTDHQQTIDDGVPISAEILGTDQADVMVLLAIADAQASDMTPAVDAFMSNPPLAATHVAKAEQIFPVNRRQIYGTSRARAMDATQAFADIIGQDGLNRDLVQE